MTADQARRSHRYRLYGEADVRFANWPDFKRVYTVNISIGGISIEQWDAPELGTRVATRLVIPLGWAMEIDGVVRHLTEVAPITTRYRVGIEFVDVDDRKRAVIEETIHHELRRLDVELDAIIHKVSELEEIISRPQYAPRVVEQVAIGMLGAVLSFPDHVGSREPGDGKHGLTPGGDLRGRADSLAKRLYAIVDVCRNAPAATK